ncbi:MAG: hypothetical protein Q4G48_06805 [Bacteroidia bacterium]|nr:hypothetical protein [Bacteroidia bacterium]
MKKVILSIALIAGIFAVTNVQAANTITEQPIIEVIVDDDGYVDVKFEDLNEKVQEAVTGVAQEFDLNVLQYNAEKQLTKVEATKKDDQTKKTFYFDAEGAEVVPEAEQQEQREETIENQQELPSAGNFYSFAQGDDGFVEAKLEDLNEKVQAAIVALQETYDIDVIKYNAEKQITKVKATNKEDQSQKKVYFDNEGVETTWEKPVEDVREQETEREEIL